MSRAVFDVTLQLAKRLYGGHAVTNQYIQEEFGLSYATAKRYMERLSYNLPVVVKSVKAGGVRFGKSHWNEMRLMNTSNVEVSGPRSGRRGGKDSHAL